MLQTLKYAAVSTFSGRGGYERSRYGYQHIPNINTFIFTIRGMKYRTYNFRQIVNSNEKVEIVKSVEQNITLFLFP